MHFSDTGDEKDDACKTCDPDGDGKNKGCPSCFEGGSKFVCPRCDRDNDQSTPLTCVTCPDGNGGKTCGSDRPSDACASSPVVSISPPINGHPWCELYNGTGFNQVTSSLTHQSPGICYEETECDWNPGYKACSMSISLRSVIELNVGRIREYEKNNALDNDGNPITLCRVYGHEQRHLGNWHTLHFDSFINKLREKLDNSTYHTFTSGDSQSEAIAQSKAIADLSAIYARMRQHLDELRELENGWEEASNPNAQPGDIILGGPGHPRYRVGYPPAGGNCPASSGPC